MTEAGNNEVRQRLNDQRRMAHEQPLHRLHRNARCGPGAGIAGADLARIGKAGFQRRAGLAVDHRHLMPGFRQIPCRGHADNARAKNDNLHLQPLIVRALPICGTIAQSPERSLERRRYRWKRLEDNSTKEEIMSVIAEIKSVNPKFVCEL